MMKGAIELIANTSANSDVSISSIFMTHVFLFLKSNCWPFTSVAPVGKHSLCKCMSPSSECTFNCDWFTEGVVAAAAAADVAVAAAAGDASDDDSVFTGSFDIDDDGVVVPGVSAWVSALTVFIATCSTFSSKSTVAGKVQVLDSVTKVRLQRNTSRTCSCSPSCNVSCLIRGA